MLTIDQDLNAWLMSQAAAVRERDYEAIDWDNLAEEIEAMARSERREVKNRLTIILIHLLKLKFERDQTRRRHGWRSSVIEQRRQIANTLEVSPGLFQGKREEVLVKAYGDARRDAALESQLPTTTFPEECPWLYEQVMDTEFFPV
ncbi:MAG TPA: DUF29 domain-containing protein [Candidatus Binataceae bacterium]|nr:DUF29 domain-containing protein [Candidatus Binataceae bacterium]